MRNPSPERRPETSGRALGLGFFRAGDGPLPGGGRSVAELRPIGGLRGLMKRVKRHGPQRLKLGVQFAPSATHMLQRRRDRLYSK